MTTTTTDPVHPAADEKSVITAAIGKVDIEHVYVQDDPRKWSNARKNAVLAIIAAASMIAGLSANIQNPSNAQIEQRLHASSSDISLSIALFILIQGNAPLLWSAVSEIKGRKLVYLVSIALYTIGSSIVASANSIALVIAMRCLQGAGSSAVIAIGAATLADVFEPSERGTKMGIYYAAPMLGPSLGPILGGVLTQGFDWRASFWFLVIFGGLNFLSFLFLFKDTFRRERSHAYQTALRRRTKERLLEQTKASSEVTTVADGGEISSQPIHGKEQDDSTSVHIATDVEAQNHVPPSAVTIAEAPALDEIKLSLMDVNPFKPVLFILRRRNNVFILIPSGLLFAFSFCITYTCSRTLGSSYNYNSLQIGLVLLAFGVGNISGSLLGGRWSDRVLARLKAKNGGNSYAEMRLESTTLAMWFLPPSVVGYAWTCQQHVHVSAICVMLFLAGFFSLWIYASTLAYIVDANVGRSSTAVATNSSFRGLFAFVAAEIAVPLQDAIGDGGMYTIWAGLLAFAELLILLVMWKGGEWREEALAREGRKSEK